MARSRLDEIFTQESMALPHFSADDAYDIGTQIRDRLPSLSGKPAVVNITLADSNNLLFHAHS
jgi:uncharacterized protein (UPF0303 family)